MSPNKAADLADASAVCLDSQDRRPGCELEVDGDFTAQFRLRFNVPTDDLRRTHNDLEEATELGAAAVAVNVICELTDYVVVLRSKKGTGFDYWLGPDAGTFEARLEVSGILKGQDRRIGRRVAEKLDQMEQSDGSRKPGWVVVVEFSKPCARVKAK